MSAGRRLSLASSALRTDAAAERRQTGPEDVGHEHDIGVLADRALDRGGLAQLAGRPHQLRVGVADVVPGQALLPVLGDQRLAREAVVDRAGLARGRPWMASGRNICELRVMARPLD